MPLSMNLTGLAQHPDVSRPEVVIVLPEGEATTWAESNQVGIWSLRHFGSHCGKGLCLPEGELLDWVSGPNARALNRADSFLIVEV
jgi:hypothetical protein